MRDSALLRGLFATPVAGVEAVGARRPAALWSEERASLGRPVAARLRQFAAGRMCARGALARLGASAQPIPMAADRQPRWPRGFVGSITHTQDYCAAVVGTSGSYHGLGLDAERVDALEPWLWSKICTAAELRRVLECAPRFQQPAIALIFAAKEALYKCLYPRLRMRLGFHAVSVAPVGGYARGCADGGCLRIARGEDHAQAAYLPLESLQGRYRFTGELVIVGVAWSRPAESTC